MKLLALVVVVAVAAGCAQDAPPAATPQPLPTPSTGAPTPTGASTPTALDPNAPVLRLEPYLRGFDAPILLTHDGVVGEVYVVEQGGVVWRVIGTERSEWIDVSADIRSGGEQGLLGLAFDLDGGRAYISYTDTAGDSVVQRVEADMRRETILEVDQPYANHNGGHLAFGPDGYLWFGLGDGGSAGDPQGNGQDPDALLGSLLRLDVSGDSGYQNAPGNLNKEIWAKGLRNPWRFTFDRETGDLYVADVGQNKYEEVNFVPAGTPGGVNFGWNAYEGTHGFGLSGRTFSAHTPPVAEYTHDDGCSVTGGYVYRGAAHPELVGIYFFGDYCSGKIWGLRNVGGTWSLYELLDTEHSISSFGEDAEGELYAVDRAGEILRLTHGGGPIPDGLRG